MESVGAVILAAGGSTRLGQPKQLLRLGGEVLVRRAVRAAGAAGCAPVVIVVGDESAEIAQELSGLDAQLCAHPQWARGIGSSIRMGLAPGLFLEPDLSAVIVMVCDQPFVTAETLRALVAARTQTGHPAAACAYAGTIGVPALFTRALFPRLAALPDGEGARAICAELPGQIAVVDFPPGAIDIDTPADCRAHLPPEPAKSARASSCPPR